MHSSSSPLLSVLFVLAAALVSASILHKLRQPSIIGFILGGILIGPHGFGLVPYENVELLSEVGIGLLMFTIGVELSIQQLLRVKGVAIIGGSILIFWMIGLAFLLRHTFHLSFGEAAIWGMTTGLSSTVVVLKLLAERGEIGSAHGNVASGILLFQDIASIPMLVAIPILAGFNSGTQLPFDEVAMIMGKLGLYLVVLYTAARFLVPPLLKFVANTHSKELFSIAVLCITLVIAAITHELNLSLALGAFLAGLIVSESDFGNQACSEVLPMRDSFSAVFFVSIGMLADIGYVGSAWRALAISLPLVLIAKFSILLLICFAFRYQAKISVFTALALTQISEFSFLILTAANQQQMIGNETYQLILANAILTIVLTPYLLKLHPKAKRLFVGLNKTQWISRGQTQPAANYYEENKLAHSELSKHVIVCGYGPTGSLVAKKLQSLGLPTVIIDLNYKVIQELKAQKQHAIYGDSSSLIVLNAAGIQTASLLVVTIPDPLAMQSLVVKVKQLRPDLTVIMRVKYMSDRDKLLSLGADDVVWEEYEAGRELIHRAEERLNLVQN
jgi:CPA2 family monovalent cation:H+ antiporter-2